MDALQNFSQADLAHSYFPRAMRSDYMLRIELSFEGMPVLHGVTDNAGQGGLLAHCPTGLCQKMVGRVGLCRVFIGVEYLEIPCRAVRVVGDALAIHLLDGYDEEYNMIMNHEQNNENAQMGLYDFTNHIGVHSMMVGEGFLYH